MFFSLEILQAHHGDCLLLHYGTETKPQLIVIDGGPKDIYADFLRPRLIKIKDGRSPNDPLPIAMVMVSHLDDDHLNGIVELIAELRDAKDNNEKASFRVSNIWMNTFDDIMGNVQLPKISSIPASVSSVNVDNLGLKGMQDADGDVKAVIATTAQGIEVRNAARKLSIEQNFPFKAKQGLAKIVRGDIDESVVKVDSNLTLTVLSPGEKRLQSLQKQWDKDLKTLKDSGEFDAIPASVVAFDTSPFNVSSIICLAEVGNKRMLLMGDGRSDDAIKGLEAKGLLAPGGTINFDVVKLPHHGSKRNIREDFLQRVTAKNWVISADGSNDNPDDLVLDFIANNIKQSNLWITNRDGKKELGKKITKFLGKCDASLKVKFLDGKPSMIVDLEENVTF